MNDFFRKLLSRITGLWAKWSMPQRIILIVVVLAVIIGVIALFSVSSAPTMVNVWTRPITDPAALSRITDRIDAEGIKVNVTSAGLIQTADDKTARRIRMIAASEGLIPDGFNPWDIFDRESWTITDFERNVNLQRAQQNMVQEHLKSMSDLDNAKVILTFPKKELFAADQNPVTASVVITPKPGSDILTNRKKIEGIQKVLKYAVVGLTDENIVITDNTGMQLNDFSSMEASDRLDIINKGNTIIYNLEQKYRKDILASIQQTYGNDRVRVVNLKIDMDMSKKDIQTKENYPFTLKPRTPGLPYDDSVMLPSVTVGESTSQTNWKGTGMNPEGPAGVEGQTPPAFKDMSNLYGEMTQDTKVHNEEINQRNIQEEKTPQIDRVTVSVNIDGTWKVKYDDKGKPIINPDGSIEREYTPIPQEDLRSAQLLIQDAIGFNASRGDSVTVRNIAIDRTAQFKDEDTAYFRKQQVQTTVLVFLSGLTILLISFIVFRMVSRELERRRRLAEDERSRREMAIRESVLAQAEEDGVDVSISVEERTRMELLEAVMNMAREHPEDCGQLIRTWLLEE